jgi:hypothetical protein
VVSSFRVFVFRRIMADCNVIFSSPTKVRIGYPNFLWGYCISYRQGWSGVGHGVVSIAGLGSRPGGVDTGSLGLRPEGRWLGFLQRPLAAWGVVPKPSTICYPKPGLQV